MKIRTQTSMLFVPLFLAFVLANGLYFLSGKNQEIQWGVRESIQSVAVTLNAIVEENGLSAGLTKVKNMLWKMQERNSYLVGLQVYQERDHALLLNWNVSLERVIPLMSKTDNYKELNIVHNDILGSNYSKIATMGTSTNGMIFKGFFDYSEIGKSYDKAVFGVIVFSAIAMLVSIIVSLYISRIIIQPIKEMLQIANVMNKMEMVTAKINKTNIKEFDDLSGTLETVQSVVLDTIRSTQKQLIESEQTRDNLEITRFLSHTVSGKIFENITRDGLQISVGACLTGLGRPGHFLGTNGDWVYAGLVASRPGKQVEYDAFSISRISRDCLKSQTVFENLKRIVLDVYRIEWACFVQILEKEIRVYRIRHADTDHESIGLVENEAKYIVTPKIMSERIQDVVESSEDTGIENVLEGCSLVFSDCNELCIIGLKISTER